MRATSPTQAPTVQRPMTFLRPHDAFPALGSLYGNGLGSEGGKAVANVLPQTKLTSLKCAFPQLTPLASCSAPHDIFHFSCTRHRFSLNNLKVEGGKAVAEALPKSSLTSLKCAAALMFT